MAPAPKISIDLNGVIVHASISPCSWMYPGYGFQFSLSLKENGCNAECVFVNNKELVWSDIKFPVNTLTELSAAWLKEHGVAPLQEKLDAWLKIEAEYRVEDAKRKVREEKRMAKLIVKRKAEGYTHRFFAWIHPARGDDYQVEAFTKGAPTAVDIAAMLKKSTVKNDYVITAL